jgi:hypothetical protein
MDYKYYYLDGSILYNLDYKKVLHRIDGPAIEWYDGTKEWFINGIRHREDGPAFEWANGIREWWLNGNRHSQQEFEKLIRLKAFW